jgi:ribosome-binding factor A
MENYRNERISATLREELAEIINYELTDPRIQTVVVTEVFVPPGGKQVHVRLAIEGTTAQQTETLEALEHAATFIRFTIAERIDVFRIPDIKFFADVAPELRAKSSTLMRRIKRGRPKAELS